MGTDAYRESQVLRVALDEFLEKAAEVEKARSVLYGDAAPLDTNTVGRAVMAIYDSVPVLRTAVDAFQWVIDEIEDEETAAKPRSRK